MCKLWVTLEVGTRIIPRPIQKSNKKSAEADLRKDLSSLNFM